VSRTPASTRERLGFRDGEKGTHSSRTLMLAELTRLLDATQADASVAEFRHAVVEDNVLGKRTETTREHTVRKLKALYGLDPALPVYRVMRALWPHDEEGRPLLALLCAAARDPLLRASAGTLLDLAIGASLTAAELAAAVSPRFSESTRAATGRNLASSWTQAGFLAGGRTKRRVRANATPGAAAYALALGFMEGGRGSLLLSTPWARLLDRPPEAILNLVQQAARRGWVEYRAAGDVVDLRVEGLFTERERGLCDGQPG